MDSENVSCTAQAKWKNYMQKGCVSVARQHLAGRSICRVGPFGTYCKEPFPFCCTMCSTTNRRHHKTRCFRASSVSGSRDVSVLSRQILYYKGELDKASFVWCMILMSMHVSHWLTFGEMWWCEPFLTAY